MGKYKLKIDYSTITEENFDTAVELRPNDNEIVTILGGSRGVTSRVKFQDDTYGWYKIPKEWLTEIEEDDGFDEVFNGKWSFNDDNINYFVRLGWREAMKYFNNKSMANREELMKHVKYWDNAIYRKRLKDKEENQNEN